MAMTMFQTVGGGSGGGGAASIDWYLPDSTNYIPASIESDGLGLENIVFDYSDTNTVFAMFTVPSSYTAGTQIFLKNGKVFSQTNTGNFLLRTIAYIFRANTNANSTPTGHTSTNSQQAIDGTAYEITVVSNLDLTDSSGQINGVAVAAGDTILVRLERIPGSETSGLANYLKLLRGSFELVLS